MTKNRTFFYLAERYRKTKWPYYSLSYTRYDVGESFQTDIKELSDKGTVKPVPGINGWLICLVKPEAFL